MFYLQNIINFCKRSEEGIINRRNSFRANFFAKRRSEHGFHGAILRAKQVERDSERRSPPLTPIFTVRDRPRYYRIYDTRVSSLAGIPKGSPFHPADSNGILWKSFAKI